MSNASAPYYNIAVETFIPEEPEPTAATIRVRPLEGQGVSTNLRVECSRSIMRNNFPIGTVFILEAKLTDRQGSKFIYSYFGRAYAQIDRTIANTLIEKHQLGFFSSALSYGVHKFENFGAKVFCK